nr:hypothetical protein [Tanacetum cinerariifolium]
KQTDFGKESSNPFMADNLPKIVWFSTHYITCMKSGLVQKQTALGQTATGKESSNPFMAGVNTSRSDDDRLKLIELMVFLMQNGVYDEFGLNVARLSKFLLSGKCDVTRLQALADKKKIVISEEVVREILQLNDAEGVICLLNEEIFAGLARMGYEKPTSWNEFSSAMASALICLSSGQRFNFSKYIFESLKFFIHTILHSLSAKRTSWNEFSSAMASALICLSSGLGKVSQGLRHLFLRVCLPLGMLLKKKKHRVEGLENANAAQQLEIIKLKARVKKLEKLNQVKSSKLRRLKKVGTSQCVESLDDVENVFNQGRNIVDMDQDEGIELEHEESYKNIDWNTALDHVQSKEPQYIKRYHGIKTKPQTESEARKNMISYLKNTEGFKMEFFKGKTYDEILPLFQARFDANMKFLFKSREEMEKEDEDIIKNINETPAQKAAKRRKLSEEAQEADDLKKRLEIIQDEDDDVFVEATPLAQKVPVVDYQVVVIDNKPKYKIIRADDTNQFYISFTTLLKNFDREDLETLRRILRDKFSTSKPTNFLDEYLLLTLKTMFGELDGHDAIWRNQKSVHGLALVKRWKLLTSCGVYVIILSTVQLFLLVERRYPVSRFTLEQLVNVAILQVEEESEMSLELLKFTRQQLQEYQHG